ncbi:MAG: alpha/beta hydrolase [Candidatus Eisenbacteria bacterium]
MKLRVVGIAAFVLAALLVLGWIFAVPGELKTLVHFSRWQGSHVRASGYVDRAPAGTRVYWEEFGKRDGPPVVVLHAGLCSLEFMGGQIEALANASYRVIAIDSRGHGKSSNTAPVLTYEMLTDDVAAVMDSLAIARADLVVWSDGGNLALDLARRYPEHVRRLVAFGANRTPPPDGQDAKMTQEFKDAKADAGMLAPLRYLYEKNSSTPDKWPEFFARGKAMVFAGPNWSLEQLGAIRARVLLENGEHDLVLLPYATAMKDAIPGARLEIVRGEGHELPLASPAKANPIMLSFLRHTRLEPRGDSHVHQEP